MSIAQEFVTTKLVDTNTPIPGGTGSFGNLSTPKIHDDGTIIFEGGSCQQEFCPYDGIYELAGDSLVPGTQSPFNAFGVFDVEGENIAFVAYGENREHGIYLQRVGARKPFRFLLSGNSVCIKRKLQPLHPRHLQGS